MDSTRGEYRQLHPSSVDPQESDIPFLKAGPKGAVRPCRDSHRHDVAGTSPENGECGVVRGSPVRISGRVRRREEFDFDHGGEKASSSKGRVGKT